MGLLIPMLFEKGFPAGSANRFDDRAMMIVLEKLFELGQELTPLLGAPASDPMHLADELATGGPQHVADERVCAAAIPDDAEADAVVSDGVEQFLDCLIGAISDPRQERQPMWCKSAQRLLLRRAHFERMIERRQRHEMHCAHPHTSETTRP